MDAWEGLRTAAVIVVWVTVAGGLLMATIWFAAGGAGAVGPEDELMASSGARVQRRSRRVTSLSSAQVGMHGLLGILTACLVTYGALLDDDRTGGYVALLVAIAVTALPGILMFRKWRSGRAPDLTGIDARPTEGRSEDRLPRPVVYLHGLAALTTAAIVVALLVVD